MYGQPGYPPQPGYGQPMAPMGYPPQPGYPPAYGAPGGYPPAGYAAPNPEMEEMKKQLASLKDAQRKKEEADGYQEMSKKLDGANSVYIKQKFDFMEMLTGCDQNNKYDVFKMENGKPVGAPLFRWTESSSCFQRTCMSADCRSMDMKVTNLHHINKNLDQEVMSILRPCKMTVACFNRQEIQIQWVEGGERKFIGKVVDPWDCCNFSVP